MAIICHNRLLLAGVTHKFLLQDSFDRSGMLKYVYIGHTKVNIDFVGLEPILGFEIVTQIMSAMKLTVDGAKPNSVITTDWIEAWGDLGYVSFTKGDSLSIKNLDAVNYRLKVVMVIDEDYKLPVIDQKDKMEQMATE